MPHFYLHQIIQRLALVVNQLLGSVLPLLPLQIQYSLLYHFRPNQFWQTFRPLILQR